MTTSDLGHLLDVALIYTAEIHRRAGRSRPQTAVTRHFGITSYQAARAIRRCRQMGFLPPTTMGTAYLGLATGRFGTILPGDQVS